MLALVASTLALPAKKQVALLAPQATTCSCTSTESATATCVSKGDPHLKTFAGTKYDFMATGTYQLLKAATTCGCDVEIQTFLFANPAKPSASYNVAVAMQAGTTTFVVSGVSATVSVYESGTLTGSYNADTTSNVVTVSGLSLTPFTKTKKGKTVAGWSIQMPGGGNMDVYAYPKDVGAGTGFGAILSLTVSAPASMVSAAAGLCTTTCSGKPPLPNEQCGDSDVCLPVFTASAVFPSSFLSNLESVSGTGVSTRPGGDDCVDITDFSPPPSPPPPMTASPSPSSGGSCDASWLQGQNCNEGGARKDYDDQISAWSGDDFEVCRAFCEAKAGPGCCKLNVKNDICTWYAGTEHYSSAVNKNNRYTIMCSGESTSTASPPPPPPPAAPGVVTCGHFDMTQGGQWLSNIQVTEWSNSSSMHDCSNWCLQQTADSCKIKNALMIAGVELRCAYIDDGAADSETGESGSCAAVAGKGMAVTSVSSALYFVAPVACNINKYAIVPCDPSPNQVCEDEGIPIATAQAACAGVVSFEECVYDYCASGGDCDDICTGFGDDPPPPPPPPPSTPPSAPPPVVFPPPPSSPDGEAFDDPHVKTLSGKKFFMHGVGVYDYASFGSTTTQVYLCPFARCSAEMMKKGTCLTFISAVAVKTPGHLLVVSGDSLLVDGTERKAEPSFVSDEIKVASEGFGKPRARIAHDKLADCHEVGKKEDARWLYGNCTDMRRTITSPDLSLDIGVVGPFEKGWLIEEVSDRTFNIEVTGTPEPEHVRGIINGDKNGLFQPAFEQKFNGAVHTDSEEVTAENAGKPIFPAAMLAKMNAKCIDAFEAPHGMRMSLWSKGPLGLTKPIKTKHSKTKP